jgi:hypothetical protein
MKLAGWETRSVFERYNVIDEADLAAAVSKRFDNAQHRTSTKTPLPPILPIP